MRIPSLPALKPALHKLPLPAPEILIAGALAGVLAMIGAANFREARTAADVAMVKAQLDSLRMALAAYELDHGAFPNSSSRGNALAAPGEPMILERLSTPIAYIGDAAATAADPFVANRRLLGGTAATVLLNEPLSVAGSPVLGRFYYSAWNSQHRYNVDAFGFNEPFLPTEARAWALSSAGPDLAYQQIGGVITTEDTAECVVNLLYDPTNGTMSAGSIYAGSPAINRSERFAAGTGLLEAIRLSDPDASVGREFLELRY